VKRKLLPTIFFLLIFLSPTVAAAWFVQSDVPDCPTVSSTTLPCVKPHSFSVYGGPFAKAADGDDAAFIRPSNPFFVPVNVIELDIPLSALTKQPLSTMEYLDRMLLANLRIRLLIQEYKDLQNRAGKLLKSLEVPFFDKPGVNLFVDKGKNIEHHKKHMETKLSGILRNGRTGPSKALGFDGPVLPDLKRLSSMPAGGNIPRKTSQPPMRTAPGSSRGSSTVQTHFTAGGGEDYCLTGSYETQLPWIFQIIMDVVEYSVSHKIEVVFYGLVFFLFCCFISLQARV
jgi:hypothetical protein